MPDAVPPRSPAASAPPAAGLSPAALLEIAERWHRTRALQPLLHDIAAAAARLLQADRASIFLWDRDQGLLVGQPALGVPGGVLRVPDDAGVVGRVLHSGRPLRVDAATDPTAIDRRADAATGYSTRTLLCVPLRAGSGELLGVFEVINKRAGPFAVADEQTLLELAQPAATALENARDREHLLEINRGLREQAASGPELIGHCPAIVALRDTLGRVAATDLAVLVLGESGTGKEVVARAVHEHSPRRGQPLVALNCAAIPEALAESELFGHEKGAFTDARQARAGKFELAGDGTLFLDEIGELSRACQAKLLRVLEEREFTRVGGTAAVPARARIVAATNQSLPEMVRAQRFREDLYFRLNVVALELPPLRQRGDDVLELTAHFLDEFAARAGRRRKRLTPAAEARLLAYRWPGNVRELRNVLERLAYLSAAETIDAEELAPLLPAGREPLPGDEAAADTPELRRGSRTSPAAAGESAFLAAATRQFQIEHIRRTIARHAGNLTAAAAALGLHRVNLYRKMRALGMPSYRAADGASS